MKKILGLDLGTNSIGWAVVNQADQPGDNSEIVAAGSRIIPMSADILSDFSKGNTVSQTATRTAARGARRLLERHKLRRQRLLRVLREMGFLPEHFASELDEHGSFKDEEKEPKLAWAKGSDGKMHFLFEDSFKQMLNEFRQEHNIFEDGETKIPYDWTLYFLRKKALHEAVSPQELAWVLLSFNRKRGYHQLRSEDAETEEKEGETKEYVAQKVVNIVDTGEKDKKGNTWYDVILGNGMVYHRTFTEIPDWVGSVKEFIVTTTTDKKGNVKQSLKLPAPDDWALVKKRREHEIDQSGLTVGEYIYNSLLHKPDQKIIGGLVSVIERTYYRDELIRILDKQKEYIPQLCDADLYRKCLDVLYANNVDYRKTVSNRDFKYLLVDDIIFYQRPLKSKKSLISDCPYESRMFKTNSAEAITVPLKCIAKSNPLYQEFRLWQFVSNVKILEREKVVNGKIEFDVDVTSDYISTENDKVSLFNYLNDLPHITQPTFLKHFFNKNNFKRFRWNYQDDDKKQYPCNETRGAIISLLKSAKIKTDFLNAVPEISNGETDGTGSNTKSTPQTALQKLWHILYSIDSKDELRKALTKFAKNDKNGIEEKKNTDFVEALMKSKPYAKEYGAYSEKAVKKLLALMRAGGYWNESNIDAGTIDRIHKLIDGEYDEHISVRIREKVTHMTSVDQFRNLPLWLACYVVYNRHSEAKDTKKWESPDDIQRYLDAFKLHSLRNPIVEQVVTETLRMVMAIWREYGKMDEIHIELGRELKNSADKRKEISEMISQNETARMRAKLILAEYMDANGSNGRYEAKGVKAYSPSQLDLFRIYEDGALNKEEKLPEDVIKTLNALSQADVKKRPSNSEVNRYLHWLEQNYCSPYTGAPIPLGKLFSSDYEIEHIIPQSRYFDDSFSNKVICEAAVNKLKNRRLGLEFIRDEAGKSVDIGDGKKVQILSEEAYTDGVKKQYAGNRAKLRKLLMDDIPDGFINRQLNDSRYISKLVKSLLSNVVRDADEYDDISKHIVVCSGAITDRLKQDWGVNAQWNSIILPRFERMNNLTGRSDFTSVTKEGHTIPSMPLELQRGFNKKRIDHRHHAMDAIVIACATRDHVNLLNNEAALSDKRKKRHDLSVKLRIYKEKKCDDGVMRNVPVAFKLPWQSFPADVRAALSEMVVSFKQNLRVVTKANNRYQHFKSEGLHEKEMRKQEKGDLIAIRKSMHKDTVYGEINLRRVKPVRLSVALNQIKLIVNKDLKTKLKELVAKGYTDKQITKYFADNKDVWSDVDLSKIEIYYFTKDSGIRIFATRKPLDTSFNKKKIESSVADTGIQKILLNHLERNKWKADKAFSPEGIEEMNSSIVELNNGHRHQPIKKVRVYETADKFAVGTQWCSKKKFVEADKGTNLFFAVYETKTTDDKTGEVKTSRSYATIPLKVVIDRMKRKLSPAPENGDGVAPSFVLSPNDLVYVPTELERKNGNVELPLKRDRIYKFVSSAKKQAAFVPYSAANVIFSMKKDLAEAFCVVDNVVVNEFGCGSPQSKNERAVTGEMIKEVCIPLSVDRLGRIKFRNK